MGVMNETSISMAKKKGRPRNVKNNRLEANRKIKAPEKGAFAIGAVVLRSPFGDNWTLQINKHSCNLVDGAIYLGVVCF